MLSDEDKLIVARVQDAVRSASERYVSRFIGFLDEHKLSLAIDTAQAEGYRNFISWGGYPLANRCIFGVFAPYDEPSVDGMPICAVRAEYRKSASLSHRDFLGSLMSVGIKRESVGDILVGEGSTVIFLHRDICEYVLRELTKVGGEGVRLSVVDGADIDYQPRFQDIRDTLASARADCVVASLARLSRTAAAELIGDGAVFINHAECSRTADSVCDGDTVSIRGCGKFIIDSIGGQTRKGRIILSARKYI
ncbi:MAG: YlmH/Sll1252 family protein [Firmicutes bacterium]|nr:YlmH/Sll1252 family protein [Bacillota bacterium]